jgi:hypothetical protein
MAKPSEFTCSDGSSGIILPDGRMIYHAQCAVRGWSSNAPGNVWFRIKRLVGAIAIRRLTLLKK